MIILIILTDDEFSRFKNRDPGILERLYHEYKKPVYNFLVIKTKGNIDIVNEVVSETFYAMIVSAPKIKDNKSIQNWLLKIASRKLADYFRKAYSEKRKLNSLQDNQKNDSRAADPMRIADVTENQEILMLNLALENVREKYQRVLKLKYLEKKSLKELSEMMNEPLTTVNGLLVRARRELKKEFMKIAKELE
jgi:RNA polymerase sigma-70 factor (ECF subfamily)